MNKCATLESSERKLAYIVSRYPSLNMTFVEREIREIERRGICLVLLAIRQPAAWEKRVGVPCGIERTKYMFSLSLLGVLQSIWYFLVTDVLVGISTFLYLVTRRHESVTDRIRTLVFFIQGIMAAAALRPEKIDHIHAHFADGTALVAMVASRLLGVPYSVTAHAYDIYVTSSMLEEKLTNAKFVTTCTAYNKTYLENITGLQIYLVYHGLDITTIKPRLSPRSDNPRPVILSIGTLREKKGFPYLIRACRLLKNRGHNFLCIIVGEGPMQQELEQLIMELNLRDSVALIGALSNEDVMEKYAEATLFVQPSIIAQNSDRDGIPNVVLEAMASGVPVVATQVSGIPEVIADGITGLLVQPQDERALAAAMGRLVSDSKLSERLASNGRKLVEERFDIRTNADRLVELFQMSPTP